jgi:hypothetical protein
LKFRVSKGKLIVGNYLYRNGPTSGAKATGSEVNAVMNSGLPKKDKRRSGFSFLRGNMKNFRLILMAMLVLAFSLPEAFAEDFFKDIGKQINSGISGLKAGDYAGVKAGMTNFVRTTPVLSQSYSLGQTAGTRISNIYTGLSITSNNLMSQNLSQTAGSRLSGIYASLSFAPNKSFAGDCLNGISKQITSGISGLNAGDYAGVKAGLTNFVTTTPLLSQSYSIGQAAGSKLSGVYAGLSTTSNYLTGINKQIISGISGLKAGDYAGVKAGLTNFVTTTPVLSQSYSWGQIAGSKLSNKINFGTDTSSNVASKSFGMKEFSGSNLFNINTGLNTYSNIQGKSFGMGETAVSRMFRASIDQGTTYTISAANN